MPQIYLKSVPYQSVKGLMKIAFADDAELLASLTPIKGDTLDSCIERCFSNIEEMFTGRVYAESQKIAYVIEFHDGKKVTDIGYTVIAKTPDTPNELYSFGINIHYRSKAIVLKWLNAVKILLGQTFWTSLYKDNSRAINFFEKNGFKKVESECRSFVSLWSNLTM